MPLPLILGIGAAIAGVAGVGAGVHGAVKMKDANDTMKSAQACHKLNIERMEDWNKTTTSDMDKLGKLELEILQSFGRFSDVIEKIKNRPVFHEFSKDGVILPKYDPEKLKEVSIGAGVLLGGLGGAALGTAGGFAAAGATTAAVMAFGTASTGAAINSLLGAAATKATLAALGGGAIAAGGGGIALGTTILGATTLGVGLLVGGIIFSVTGSKLSDKADEAWAQMKKAEKQIDEICDYLKRLRTLSNKFYATLEIVNTSYQKHLNNLEFIVNTLEHNDWNMFTPKEKQLTENTVLLVGLLYKMCQVELVLKRKGSDTINSVNNIAVEGVIQDAQTIMIKVQ